MTCRSPHKHPNNEAMTREDQIVFVLDLAGNFKFINAAAERVSGYSRAEACGMNVTDVLAPGLEDYVRRQLTDALNGHFGAVYEIEIITKDSRRVVLETSAHLVMRNGEPFELHGIAFPAVKTRECDDHMQPRCLDHKFVSMLIVSASLPLTNRHGEIINLGSYGFFKI